MSGAIALVLTVQSIAGNSTVVPVAQTGAAQPAKSTFVPQTHLYGVAINQNLGTATITLSPFTPVGVARALGAQYGMTLINSSLSFGSYTYTLPQIRIGAGPVAHTATVYFPPYATQGDINTYLVNNGLTVTTWTSTDDQAGRVAVVALPQVKPVLYDARRGIWRAVIATNLSQTSIQDWAKTNGMKVISYTPSTGVLLLQGPVPQPVYVRTLVRRPRVSTSINGTTTQTTKLYLGFKPGTTFNQAQQVVQQAGGQITSYNSTSELATVTVPVTRQTQATSTLHASALVSCVSASSTACPGQTPSTTPSGTTSGSGTDTNTAPASSTETGTGWTTTDVPPPTTTALLLTAAAADGHISLTWNAVNGAQSYQVMRAAGTDAATLVATTTATTITDVGGTPGVAYSYRVIPVLSTGPDATQTQTGGATWVAATSTPVLLQSGPQSSTLSGSVALSAEVRTGDGVATAAWSLTAPSGTTTQIATATAAAGSTDPLTGTANAVWNSRGVADGPYSLLLTVTDGAGHSTQLVSQVRVG